MFLHLSVSHSVHRREWGGAWSRGRSAPRGVPGSGEGLLPGECLVQGGLLPGRCPPVMATAAGSTHPTGMHSCFFASLTQRARREQAIRVETKRIFR